MRFGLVRFLLKIEPDHILRFGFVTSQTKSLNNGLVRIEIFLKQRFSDLFGSDYRLLYLKEIFIHLSEDKKKA